MLDALDIPMGQLGATDAGSAVEAAVEQHLKTLRPDLEIARSRASAEFSQYRHLAVFKAFSRNVSPLSSTLMPMRALIAQVPDDGLRSRLARAMQAATDQLRTRDDALEALLNQMPEESLLKIDLTVGEPDPGLPPRLCVALSSKWTLRTDRAQDCLSQGAKLVSLRRGPMPHYAVITMESRPHMLKILADGSGSLDCVYHLHLPALIEAIERTGRASKAGDDWLPARTFRRLLNQGRLRDYDDLVTEVQRIPSAGARTVHHGQTDQGELFDGL
ncbi:NgoMIV family type II restriction endonuclease [Blastococcus sp. PRF04-17]|uniref:NgoMIV family type II restriction endonuclease n=1 Tax=Blastococcus sp. PRF04-17 TaxID=2933797 RepID=UPI001FF18B7D|nr:NgoMIV family type II restriction endonuclease [Blastococcus sp. PRF04-17]UOY01877.1 hypothetical protein MVA48_00350 [Blastococcus sp. PRF04-17]